MREARSEARTRRALRALLRIYPSSFRRELGADLVETAVYRWREAVGRGGWRGRIGAASFWWTEGARFALDGVLERAHALPSGLDDPVHAVRQLRRAPAHHALAVVTLALGVGATAGIVTVADAVVFRPLAYDDSGRLYLVHARFGPLELSSNSMLNLRDLQGSVRTMAWLAGGQDRSPALTDAVAEPERVSALDVTADYLPGLGARVAAGRTFGDRDFEAGAERVAVVSNALWRRRWGGDRSIVGTTVRLDEVPHTVIGVMAAGFRDPEPIESGAETGAWIPVREGDRSFFTHRDEYSFRVLGLLADGAALENARRELTEAGRRLAAAHPEANRVDGVDLDFVLHSVHALTVGGARAPLLLLAGASVLLLLLACANAANLFLARGVARAPELAVRGACAGR